MCDFQTCLSLKYSFLQTQFHFCSLVCLHTLHTGKDSLTAPSFEVEMILQSVSCLSTEFVKRRSHPLLICKVLLQIVTNLSHLINSSLSSLNFPPAPLIPQVSLSPNQVDYSLLSFPFLILPKTYFHPR
jgi:hypothetical protein